MARQINVDVQMRGDLLLVISELVANAVTHAGSSPPEVVASFDDDRIRLEVQDLHQDPPFETSPRRRPRPRQVGAAPGTRLPPGSWCGPKRCADRPSAANDS